ncbi:MAG: hypothetical protein Tsb0014_27760 [Pleurocapsa sp.]
MFKIFQKWLANNRNFLFAWYTKDRKEEQEPERSLVELPKSLRKKLVNAVENLPSNPEDIKAIASSLDDVFDLWREKPDRADNSIVILSSPVTAVYRILSETLQDWAEQKQVEIELLPLTARPQKIAAIKPKLEQYLNQKKQNQNYFPQKLQIVVIPNLNWCFLRSLEGLEGIEYLQSLLCDEDRDRFWIIGASQIGWEYLNHVCNLEAYCDRVLTLPAIAPENLQAWFEPIINEFKITFEQPRIDRQILDSEKDYQASYFDLLADITQGVSTVAVQGFLKSIGYQESDQEDEEDNTKSKKDILVAKTPKLANLPTLESADLYLLYSLLLHGDLTISALAESLGDEEGEVQARVQTLRRHGVVEQQNKVLKVNPIYYPQLKKELASNNFIIGK